MSDGFKNVDGFGDPMPHGVELSESKSKTSDECCEVGAEVEFSYPALTLGEGAKVSPTPKYKQEEPKEWNQKGKPEKAKKSHCSTGRCQRRKSRGTGTCEKWKKEKKGQRGEEGQCSWPWKMDVWKMNSQKKMEEKNVKNLVEAEMSQQGGQKGCWPLWTGKGSSKQQEEHLQEVESKNPAYQDTTT